MNAIFPAPRICPLCGVKREKPEICHFCREKLELIREEGFCHRCGTFGYQTEECENCREWPSYLVQNKALFPYAEEYRELIQNYKFRHEGWLLSPCLELISFEGTFDFLRSSSAEALLIPVPLHPKRLRERGFNQAEPLAEKLAELWAVELRKDILFRKKNTRHQTGLNQIERKNNLQEAFGTKNVEDLKGKKIILVDDILTTGSTLLECAKALKDGGVEEVYGFTLAAGAKSSLW